MEDIKTTLLKRKARLLEEKGKLDRELSQIEGMLELCVDEDEVNSSEEIESVHQQGHLFYKGSLAEKIYNILPTFPIGKFFRGEDVYFALGDNRREYVDMRSNITFILRRYVERGLLESPVRGGFKRIK